MGRADGATGWCVMIANTTALAAYHLRPDWAEKIYDDPSGCTGGFGMPSGSAIVVDGGLRVSGTWAWGSGTDHCSWIGGGVGVVDADGQPSATSDGASTPFVFFDRGDVDLLDTWQVAGLKGTASTDYTVSDAFVPDGRWAQFVGGTPYIEGPATRFSFFGALACGVAAVTIGLAQRAVDELIALGAAKPSGSRRSLAERGAIQADLATARGNAAQARSYLLHTAAEAWDQASAGRELDDQMRIDLRLGGDHRHETLAGGGRSLLSRRGRNGGVYAQPAPAGVPGRPCRLPACDGGAEDPRTSGTPRLRPPNLTDHDLEKPRTRLGLEELRGHGPQ